MSSAALCRRTRRPSTVGGQPRALDGAGDGKSLGLSLGFETIKRLGSDSGCPNVGIDFDLKATISVVTAVSSPKF